MPGKLVDMERFRGKDIPDLVRMRGLNCAPGLGAAGMHVLVMWPLPCRYGRLHDMFALAARKSLGGDNVWQSVGEAFDRAS